MAEGKKFIERKRLEPLMRAVMNVPALFVVAPTGCGKTVAVRSFVRESDCVCIWIDLYSPGDSDASGFFWRLVTKEVGKQFPVIGEKLTAQGFPSDSVQITEMFEAIQDERPERDVLLIIDNYDLVCNARADNILHCAIRANIRWLHTIVISRIPPCAAIRELIFKGTCSIVTMNDLLMTREETAELLESAECCNDKKFVRSVFGNSVGWLPAINAMITCCKRYPDSALVDAVFDLLNFYFELYDEKTQNFLLEFSALHDVDTEEAIYVFEDTGVLALLDHLCYVNPFVTKCICTYTIRGVYRSFLNQARLRKGLDPKDKLLRAARWRSQSGDHIRAIQYWHCAGDYKTILSEMDTLLFTSSTKISVFDSKLMHDAFNSVDEETKYRYPMAILKYIIYNALDDDGRLAARLLSEFKRYFDTHEHPKYTKNRIKAEILVACTALSYNKSSNIKTFMHFSKQSAAAFREHSDLVSRKYVLTFGFPCYTSAYYNSPGTYEETCRIMYTDLVKYVPKVTNGMGMGCEYLCRAEYLLDTGRMDGVAEFAAKAIYKAQAYDQMCIVVCSKMAIARLAFVQGRKGDTESILEEMEMLLDTVTDQAEIDVIENGVGFLCAMLGSPGIPDSLLDIKGLLNRRKNRGAAFSLSVFGKAMIAKREYLRFDALFDDIISKQREFQNMMGVIYSHIFHAIAHYHLSDTSGATAAMDQATVIARQDDIVMPFLEHYEQLEPLISAEPLSTDAFISKVRELRVRNFHNINNEATINLNAITQREQQVLNLLEKGYSNKQIGETLFISICTVKRHLQNIYSKLGVKSRTQAININANVTGAAQNDGRYKIG
jgi:LuxR family maltose regulon positive regulatory protein